MSNKAGLIIQALRNQGLEKENLIFLDKARFVWSNIYYEADEPHKYRQLVVACQDVDRRRKTAIHNKFSK
jgi:hypothetical protein